VRQAVLFDLDDTLIDRTGAFAHAMAALLARHPEVSPPHRRAADLAWALEVDARGGTGRTAFCRAVLEKLPLPCSAEALDEALLEGMLEALSPVPEVLALTQKVQARFATAVVSNGSSRRQRAKLSRSGLAARFEGVFISGEVGAPKPDFTLFRAALGFVDVPPERALFVGDDPARDIAPAAALGLRTCWVSHGRPYPAGLPAPTHVIAHVTQLLEVLPCAT